jgi:hypothetical protein
LFIDRSPIGTYDATDIAVSGIISEPSGMVVIFSNITGLTIRENNSTNVLIVFGHKTLSAGDSLQGVVLSNWLTGYGLNTIYTGESRGMNCYGVVKEVGGRLFVKSITNGDALLKYIKKSYEEYLEIIQLRLSSEAGEDKIVNRLKLSLYSTNNEITDTEITNLRLFIDKAPIGTYDGNDKIVSGPIFKSSGMVIIFSNITGLTVKSGIGTNILITIGHKNLSYGNKIEGVVLSNWVRYYGLDTYWTNDSEGKSSKGVRKEVPGIVKISSLTQGDSGLRYLLPTPETNVELMQVKLSATRDENKIITKLRLSLYSSNSLIGDSDITNIRLYIDRGIIGSYDGNDIIIGSNSNSIGMLVIFSNISGLTVKSEGRTNLLITIGHKNLIEGGRLQGVIKSNDIWYYGQRTIYTDRSYGEEVRGVEKIVPASLYATSLTEGNILRKYIMNFSEENIEILGIKLSTGSGEDKLITRIRISLYSTNNTIVDSDITNLKVCIDRGLKGTYDGEDIIVSGTIPQPFGMIAEFSNISGLTVKENGTTNILILIGHKQLNYGDSIRGVRLTGWIEFYGIVSGYKDIDSGYDITGVRKEVPGIVKISSLTQGDSGLRYISASYEESVEMLQLRLSATESEDKIISKVKISLFSTNNGILASDITNARIYIDSGTAGSYDVNDILISGPVIQPKSMVINFTNLSGLTIRPNRATNILVVIGHKGLNYGDSIRCILKTNWVEYYGNYTGWTDRGYGNNCIGITKEVPGALFVIPRTNGDSALRYLLSSPETNIELMQLKLSATIGEDKVVNRLKLSLFSPSGTISDTDITNIRLFIDRSPIGTYDATDIAVSGIISEPSGMVVIFSNITGLTIRENNSTNVLIVFGHKTLSYGDNIQGIINPTNIEYYGIDTRYTNNSLSSVAYSVIKEVPGDIFISTITNGNSSLRWLAKSPENNKEIMLFKISATIGENKIISKINISLEYYNGLTDANISNPKIYLDVNNNGNFDSSIDKLIATAPNPSSGVISFSPISGLTIPENKSTNILFVITHNNLNVNYGIRSKIKSNEITSIGKDTLFTNYSTNNILGIYKEVPGEIYISMNSNGNAVQRFLLPVYETNKEIISIKLSNTIGENKILQKLLISLEYNGGASDSDFTNAKIYIDNSIYGTYTTADMPLLATNIQPVNNKLYFTNITGFTIRENSTTNIILVIDHKNMNSGEGIKAYINSKFIQIAGVTTEFTNYLGTNSIIFGSATGIKKEVPGKLFVFNNNSGDSASSSILSIPELNKEIISFKISASVGENIKLNKIIISLNYGGTFNDSNITNARLFLDTATVGTYNATDKLLATAPSPTSSKLVFSNISGLTIYETNYKNILLVISHNSLNPGDSINAYILTNWISGIGLDTIYPISNKTIATGIRKFVGSAVYVSSITQGNAWDLQLNGNGESNKEIFAFSLSNYGENVSLSNIKFNITFGNGANPANFSNIVLLLDYGTIGTYDAADIPVATNHTITNPVNFNFPTSWTLFNNSVTNFLLIIDHKSLNLNEYIQIYLYKTNFKCIGQNSKEIVNLINSTNSGRYYVKAQLSESTNNISNRFVYDGQTNVPVLKFKLSASESEPVKISQIIIEGILNTSEVSNLTLLIDNNNNGLKDSSDIIYDSNKQFIAGLATFTNSSFILQPNSSTNFLVLYNFINNITPTTQYSCRILNNYITATGFNSGRVVHIKSVTIFTGVLLTSAWGQIIFTEGTNNDIGIPNYSQVVESDPNIEILQFRLNIAPMEDIITHWIKISNSGNALDSQITNIILFKDNNRNATNDLADTLLAYSKFSNRIAKFNLNLTNTANSNYEFLIVYQLSTPIPDGTTFKANIISASNTGLISKLVISNIGLPIIGNTLIKGANSQIIWRNTGGTVFFPTSDFIFKANIPAYSLPVPNYATIVLNYITTLTPLIKNANSQLPSNFKIYTNTIFKIDAYNQNTTTIMGDINNDGIQDIEFDGDVLIKYSNISSTFKNNCSINKIRIAKLNQVTGNWEIVPNSYYQNDKNEIVAHIPKFGIFAIVESNPVKNLDTIIGYPNPFSPFKNTIESRDFPGESVIRIQYELKEDAEIEFKIFNLVGDLVYSKTYQKGIPYISSSQYNPCWIEWNGKNNDGRYVSDGGYIVQITTKSSSQIEKKFLKILILKDK